MKLKTHLKSTITSCLLIPAALTFICCCSQKEKVSESEEESIYLLVGQPCSDGDYATAIRRADSLLNAPRQMSDTLTAYIMIDRDVSILEAGNPQWADAYADSVIDFGRKKNIGLAVMQGLQNKGIIHRRSGDYDEAISLYKEGLEIAVKENDEEMQQVFAEMLAIACAEQGLYEEAESFAGRSLELSQEADDSIGIFNSISTIGGILAKAGNYQKAVSELLPYHQQSRNFKGVIRVKYLTPLLRSYLQLDSLQRVHQLLSETYEALEGMPRNTQAYLVAVNTEAGLAAKEKRYADEWKWLQCADTIGAMGTTPDVWYSQRATCLANLDRYKDAYDMQQKAMSALDSLRISDNDRQLSELMVKYDTLSKDNDIQRLKSQRLVWILIALSCFVAIGILIAFGLYYRRRNLIRRERERQQEYIKGLEHERRRLARELHDDIAGSMVGLQWKLRSSSPEESENELIKLTRRVRAMSHELMPPEFDKKSFREMLADFSFRFNSDENEFKLEICDEGAAQWDKLTAEESLELYRMVQESVSNAVAHGGNGTIRILLSGNQWLLSIESPIDSKQKTASTADGIGLRTLKDRAAIIGSNIEMATAGDKYIVKIYRP